MADSTRTSTLMVSSPPTRSNSRSCRTRSSLSCSPGVTSPISSRKIVPLSASSKRPSLRLMAPVNAPFSWPNSSDSSSVSVSAPQFTFTNGPAGPLGTGVDGPRHQLLAGARFAVDVHRRVGGRDLLDGLEHRASSPASRRRSRRSDRGRRRRRAGPRSPPATRSSARRSSRSSSARATLRRTTSGANGFCRKSKAPSRIASTAVSTVPNAVTIMTGQSGSRSRTALTTSSPPVPSILRSVMTKSTAGRPLARREVGQPRGARRREHRLVAHAPHGGAQALAHRLVVVDDEDAGHLLSRRRVQQG